MILLQAFTAGALGFALGTGMAATFFEITLRQLATRGIVLMWQSVALTGAAKDDCGRARDYDVPSHAMRSASNVMRSRASRALLCRAVSPTIHSGATGLTSTVAPYAKSRNSLAISAASSRLST
jgi:hypothetical protein